MHLFARFGDFRPGLQQAIELFVYYFKSLARNLVGINVLEETLEVGRGGSSRSGCQEIMTAIATG